MFLELHCNGKSFCITHFSLHIWFKPLIQNSVRLTQSSSGVVFGCNKLICKSILVSCYFNACLELPVWGCNILFSALLKLSRKCLKTKYGKKTSMRISSLLFFHKQWNYGRWQNLIKTSLKCYTEKGCNMKKIFIVFENQWLIIG